MPNLLANIALYGWPLVAFWIMKKQRLNQAVVLLFLIPYMWLPYGMRFDLPLLPPIDKWTLPALTAFFMLKARDKNFNLFPNSRFLNTVLIGVFLSPVLTALTNTDVLDYGLNVRPGMSFQDIISGGFNNFALIYIPLVIGAHFLGSEDAKKDFVFLLAVWGLVYSLLCLWEIKMSPQLHREIYGFTTTSWRQQIRNGGFRPVIFMGHGLYVAMYMSMATICAMLLFKGKHKFMQKQGMLKVFYLFAILILCKTWSAAIYSILSFFIIFFFGKRKWLYLAAALSVIVFLYPTLRAAGLIPVNQINAYFTELDEDRGGSLGVRLKNEDILLDKARERALFGWGGWGRQRVYSEYTGEDLTIADGTWIIIFGQVGWLGYLSIFGALCGSIVVVYLRYKNVAEEAIPPYTAGLAVILSMNLVDLVPNSSLSPLTYLMAGSLFGALTPIKNRT
ncbi:hypothetical protein [Teredinibacter turnerae]|uniref:Membrane protein n=2 Tax=Teredinibacter turnerae TaxID=2426 RepID=C5BIC6_TERTT|nr:hypothetical protein [Teredinibacter turnerae]ACR13579.1 putative membrane protein [Teredinibacter turnerae T7901]